jgi:hypothetical protein
VVPAPDNPLGFYSLLARLDRHDPSVSSALAFARIGRDLLLRVAAAYAVQRGLETVPHDSVPPLALLFTLAIGGEFYPPMVGSDMRLAELQRSVAEWLLAGFDVSQPLASSYQVWVGPAGSTAIRLSGHPRQGVLPAGVELDPSAGESLASETSHATVTAIGHYDVHGIAMLALSLRTLRQHGVAEAKGVLGFEQSGDIGKLWKRTVPQALKSGGEGTTVMLIDCPVHSRTPEHTLKALRGVDSTPGSRVVIIDHHPDTIELAPLIARPGVQLVLTDVLSCALLGSADQVADNLRLLGALGDKVPEVAAAYPASDFPLLYAANHAFNEMLLHYSPTPKEFKSEDRLPAAPLWEALAAGVPVDPDLVSLALPGTHPAQAEASEAMRPQISVCGSLLFVVERLSLLGRSWYALLEALMLDAGTSYAIATRVLDGNRANMLLLTHWQHTHVPPVRNFIPPEYWPRCLGHPAAVWVDLDRREALPFLSRVANNINAFFDSPADFESTAELLNKNILDQRPSVYGGQQLSAPDDSVHPA